MTDKSFVIMLKTIKFLFEFILPKKRNQEKKWSLRNY